MNLFSPRKNWYKSVFQNAILLLLAYMGVRIWLDKTYTPDFEAYCPFGGLQALGSYFTRDSLACSMTSAQIMMGIALVVGVILFGKLFCGYICPLGTIGEWLGKLGEKLKIRFTVTGRTDKALRLLKYGLLFITFYFTLQSSELFCKKFDPYFAVASGFNSDVVVLWATIAILLLLFGSVFLRLFWCRYLCPLGAVTNLFRFWWWPAGVLGLYISLLLLGARLPWVWPLILITGGGFILEVILMKKAGPGPVCITRNTETCINCSLCAKKCPQAIAVDTLEKVEHVDCNLCGDCITACPEKDTLQINRRNMRWLPATALTVLIVSGIILGSIWELPTINVRWGTEEQMQQAGIFHQSALKNIKCFGSSTAFANQMRNVRGIHGVATFVGSHSVKVYYDTTLWNDQKIQQLIFTPVKRLVRPIGREVDRIEKHTLTVDHFFDPLDVYYMQQLLTQKSNACAFETEFGCPVILHLYFPEGEAPGKEELASIIETRTLSYTAGEREFHVRLKYRLVSLSASPETLSRLGYKRLMFNPTSMRFNKFSSYGTEILKQYQVSMQENSELKNRYSYLVSHLSNDPGVVGFTTWIDDTGEEMGSIIFVDSLTTSLSIESALHSDSLLVTYRNGETGTVVNPFVFSNPGRQYEYTDSLKME